MRLVPDSGARIECDGAEVCAGGSSGDGVSCSPGDWKHGHRSSGANSVTLQRNWPGELVRSVSRTWTVAAFEQTYTMSDMVHGLT